MKGLFQGICIGLLIVMGAAHADVGREEELDDAVRQFAAKVEAVWQQCLSRPDVHTTNDSDMCLSAMVRTSNEKVEVKYQAKLVKAQQMTESPDIFSSYERVPVMLKASQVRWKEYVKSDCDGIYEESVAGTARSTNALLCEYKHALQRLRALDGWY
ncbi:lysozyme inhibitor LprI family protein [Pseudomonas kermanshahensis]|uniref:lysozyme inhibitor LprI family protein n=1 Tax=Pseudomonas kermanshahensis TaxID=2745482 RepID=UPI0023DCC6FC|nr:lysozyme inhibitor LprI family protein [Pseudomonas kermanshahensis]WEL53648.1 lysozyme inhibitor LprI family protein [Pseudomonas kermanshahensis]